MSKVKYYFLITLGLIITSLVSSASPDNFSIKYIFKNPDGSEFRIIKYYLSDGCKYRSEYYSTIQYNINSSADVKVEGDKVESKVKADMQADSIANPVPHTIEILRKDKNLVWTMMPEFKQFFEVPLRPDAWENAVSGNFISNFKDLKKTSETKNIKLRLRCL
jgi:hypothetical protein